MNIHERLPASDVKRAASEQQKEPKKKVAKVESNSEDKDRRSQEKPRKDKNDHRSPEYQEEDLYKEDASYNDPREKHSFNNATISDSILKSIEKVTYEMQQSMEPNVQLGEDSDPLEVGGHRR